MSRGTNRPRTALITAGAGLGKSMLVTTAVDALTPRPTTVLAGTARVHAPAPYDWLAAVLDGRETRGLSVPPDALAWLAQHPDAQRERYAPSALLRMAVRTVRELVDGGPAVIVVEDLHALDPASLNLVAELATAPELRALMLVTSQPPEASVAPQLVARTLARLSGTPGSVRQHLRPLRAAETAAVLAQVFPDATTDVVHSLQKRTGGNPYYLRELLATAGTAEALDDEPLPEYLGTEYQGTDTLGPGEVLTCLAAGMSNQQVARSLGISIRTVAVHVSNLLRKTRSSSRTEAALWAVQHMSVSARSELTSPAVGSLARPAIPT
jgi:DNA-binding NarL/FixJ family response regulator